MSMIEDLIKLNREAVGPAPGVVSWVPRRRRWTDLRAVEQTLDKTRERRRLWDEETARIKAKMLTAKLKREQGRAGFGIVRTNSQWIELIVWMEPGRWYNLRGLERVVGRRKPVNWGCSWATQVFLKKVPGRWGKQLWCLNRWGRALREAVWADPGLDRIHLMELDGAKPEVWRAASLKRRKPRGGRLFEGSAPEQGRSPMS
jgi:hypothetical protein